MAFVVVVSGDYIITYHRFFVYQRRATKITAIAKSSEKTRRNYHYKFCHSFGKKRTKCKSETLSNFLSNVKFYSGNS